MQNLVNRAMKYIKQEKISVAASDIHKDDSLEKLKTGLKDKLNNKKIPAKFTEKYLKISDFIEHLW